MTDIRNHVLFLIYYSLHIWLIGLNSTAFGQSPTTNHIYYFNDETRLQSSAQLEGFHERLPAFKSTSMLLKNDLLKSNRNQHHLLSSHLVSSVYQNELQVYGSSDMTDTVSNIELRRKGAATYEGSLRESMMHYGEWAVQMFKHYEIEQDWIFGPDKLYAKLRSVAPVQFDSSSKVKQVPYVIDVSTDHPFSAHINDSNNIIVYLTQDYFSLEQITSDAEDVLKIKEVVYDAPLVGLVTAYRADYINDYRAANIDRNDLDRLINQITADTVYITDPETYEMEAVISDRGPYPFSDLQGLFIHQMWAWNNLHRTIKSDIVQIDVVFGSQEYPETLYSLKYYK